jgi:hypothetical protein
VRGRTGGARLLRYKQGLVRPTGRPQAQAGAQPAAASLADAPRHARVCAGSWPVRTRAGAALRGKLAGGACERAGGRRRTARWGQRPGGRAAQPPLPARERGAAGAAAPQAACSLSARLRGAWQLRRVRGCGGAHMVWGDVCMRPEGAGHGGHGLPVCCALHGARFASCECWSWMLLGGWGRGGNPPLCAGCSPHLRGGTGCCIVDSRVSCSGAMGGPQSVRCRHVVVRGGFYCAGAARPPFTL